MLSTGINISIVHKKHFSNNFAKIRSQEIIGNSFANFLIELFIDVAASLECPYSIEFAKSEINVKHSDENKEKCKLLAATHW